MQPTWRCKVGVFKVNWKCSVVKFYSKIERKKSTNSESNRSLWWKLQNHFTFCRWRNKATRRPYLDQNCCRFMRRFNIVSILSILALQYIFWTKPPAKVWRPIWWFTSLNKDLSLLHSTFLFIERITR